MAKAIKGKDKDADDKGKALIVAINKFNNQKTLKGCDTKILKDVVRASGKLQVDANFTTVEKLQQSIGGVRSHI